MNSLVVTTSLVFAVATSWPVAQTPVRTTVKDSTRQLTQVAPSNPIPESWTPHTTHVGVEGIGPEVDSEFPAELTEDPGATPEGDLSGNQPVPSHLKGNPYRLAFVGGDYVPERHERIDPELARAVARGLTGTTYGFVMFQGRITSAKRAAVEALGAQLGDHHTFNSMAAIIPVESIGSIAASPAVRWVGRARPRQKTGPSVARLLTDERVALDSRRRFLIKVFDSDLTENARQVEITTPGESGERHASLTDFAVIPEGPFQHALEQLGARIHAYHDDLRLFVVDAPLRAAEQLTALDFVHYVELDDRIIPAHDRSTRQIGIDYIRGIAGNDGSDTVVGMMDSGMYLNHVDTTVKWYAGWGYDGQSAYVDSTGHGTHVMGTIMSPGNGNDRFRGCAPGVGTSNDRRIFIAGIFNGPSANSTSSNAIAALARFAQDVTISNITTPHPTVVNHSWGVGTSGMPVNGWIGTDSLSIALDYRVFYDQQTHVVAAHNQGGTDYANQNYRNVLRPAVAKLAFTVANCLSAQESDGSLPGRPHWSSNKGPTGDGRLCPQIMAPGRSIGSVQAGTNSGYVSFSGTSMATPHVVGTIAGLQDHNNFMKTRPAVTRAVVAATSAPYQGSRSNIQSSDRYYNRQGFGQVDAYRSHYQRDFPGGFKMGRYYGTFTSASSGWSFDVDVPADATKTNFVLAFDEKPASQGAVRSCIHDLDIYIDVEPFSAGFNTGEYSSTRAWDTWDWYQNIASIGNLQGKTVRVKIYPRVAPTGSDVVRFGVAYMIPRGDFTPTATLDVTANPTVVQPGDDVTLTADIDVPEFALSNAFVDLNWLAGFDPVALQFFDRENVLRSFSGSSTPENWTMGMQGYWFSHNHSSLDWTLEAPNTNGLHFVQARLRADNLSSDDIGTAVVCVDGLSPSFISNLTSTSHTPNVWSNDASVDLMWPPASDNGCAGLNGLSSTWTLGGTSSPTVINLPATATNTTATRTSSTQTQFFTLRAYDNAGNTTLHSFAGPFLIDVHDPVMQSVVVDGNASMTHDPVVDVDIAASDVHSGVDAIQWSVGGVFWGLWTPYTTSFQVTLGPTEGVQTVYVRVRDVAGNISSILSDAIQYVRCPMLDTPGLQPVLDNVTGGSFALTGTDLDDVTSALIGTQLITSNSPLDAEDGWIELIDEFNLHVHPPQGMAPGSYSLSVSSSLCSSNPISVALQCNAQPTLWLQDDIDSTGGFRAFVAPGSMPTNSLIGLVFSFSNLPSNGPGVLTLEIGNAFQDVYFWPIAGIVNPATCTATIDLPAAGGFFQGSTVFFEAFLLDPMAQNPLPATTTNAVAADFF